MQAIDVLRFLSIFILTDPRTNNKFLLETPEPALLIIASYLVFVVVAPKVMEKRQPFNLRGLIIVYNFALVALSAYMATEASD